MTQHKLRLDDLEVESFQVLPEAPRERGTVQGHIALTAYAGCSRTCFHNDTCAISCPGGSCILTVCADTCDTCQRTCFQSCEGTCESCLCTYPLDFCELE